MIWVKRLVALLFLGILIYLFLPLLDELREAADLLREANWTWLPVILILQVASYSILTWLNILSLSPYKGEISAPKMAAVLTSIAFIETAVPSLGMSGVVLRARLLGRHGGYSFEASTFSMFVETFFVGGMFALVGFLGLIHLLQTGGISVLDILLLIIVALAAGGIVFLLFRLLRSPKFGEILAAGIVRVWNRYFSRFRLLDAARARTRMAEFQSGLSRYRDIPMWKFWVAAGSKAAIDVATLGACFLLFRSPVQLGLLLAGFGLSRVVAGLSSLPGGITMVDASFSVVFSEMGVPGAVALVVSLAFRLFTFWMYRVIGYVNWQLLEARAPAVRMDRLPE